MDNLDQHSGFLSSKGAGILSVLASRPMATVKRASEEKPAEDVQKATFYLPKPLLRRLRMLAAGSDEDTQSAIVTRALEAYLAKTAR